MSGSEHRLRTRLTDLAGNQSGFSNGATVKVDLEPPQVTLSAPPVSEGSFTVEWAGDDGDGSGVIAYQVDYQDNGGPWKTLLTETLELEAPFSGELYHEYTFRVRARDLVGHVSDWITSTVAVVNQTKYYFLEGRRVAMRKGDKVFYLYGDHLGSTSLTTDENGEIVYKGHYLPYGGERLSDGVSPTDFGFTDQRHEVGLGLIDYHARYYDPFLGRFISPDPIVLELRSTQAWNRYIYVDNNPLKYVDPTGHCKGLPDQAFDVCVSAVVGMANAVHSTNNWAARNQEVLWAIEAGGVDLLPIAGDAKGLVEVFTGQDLISGEQLGYERYLGLIFLSELRLLRHGDEVVEAAGFAGRHFDEAGDAGRYGEEIAGVFCSFSYETLVLTKKGLRPIGAIDVGEEVWAYDETTGELGWYPVTAVWAEEHQLVVYVTIDGQVVETTAEHPFGLTDDVWVAAGALQVGDRIREALGDEGLVERVEFDIAPQMMYNLTVAQAHTYFVGHGSWLVHNDCNWWLSGSYVEVNARSLPTTQGPSWGAIGRYSDDGSLRQIGLYDGDGQVLYHIDAPDKSTPYWHYHEFAVPGNPHVGHGTGADHIPIHNIEEFLKGIGLSD